MKQKEHALIYLGESCHFQFELENLLNTYDFDYTWVNDDNMNQSISELFQISTSKIKQCQLFPFNFILFLNIDHDKITAFYQECAKNGFPFTHKAVVTEHNKSWLLKDLLSEIAEEHDFFRMYQQLQSLLKEANTISIDAYTEESFVPYRNAFIKAYMYIKGEQLEKEIMQSLINEVIHTRNQLLLKLDKED